MTHEVEVYLNRATYGKVEQKRIAHAASLAGMRYDGFRMILGCDDCAHSYRGSAESAAEFQHDVAGLGFECSSREVPA